MDGHFLVLLLCVIFVDAPDRSRTVLLRCLEVRLHKPWCWPGACSREPEGTWQDSWRALEAGSCCACLQLFTWLSRRSSFFLIVLDDPKKMLNGLQYPVRSLAILSHNDSRFSSVVPTSKLMFSGQYPRDPYGVPRGLAHLGATHPQKLHNGLNLFTYYNIVIPRPRLE